MSVAEKVTVKEQHKPGQEVPAVLLSGTSLLYVLCVLCQLCACRSSKLLFGCTVVFCWSGFRREESQKCRHYPSFLAHLRPSCFGLQTSLQSPGTTRPHILVPVLKLTAEGHVCCRCSCQKPSQKIRVLRRGSDGQSSCPTEVVGILVGPREASSLSMTETLFQREQEDHQEDHQEYQEELDAKITRRVQRAARRTARQEQLKRLHKAQVS